LARGTTLVAHEDNAALKGQRMTLFQRGVFCPVMELGIFAKVQPECPLIDLICAQMKVAATDVACATRPT
jgi:hypothetical protein